MGDWENHLTTIFPEVRVMPGCCTMLRASLRALLLLHALRLCVATCAKPAFMRPVRAPQPSEHARRAHLPC